MTTSKFEQFLLFLLHNRDKYPHPHTQNVPKSMKKMNSFSIEFPPPYSITAQFTTSENAKQWRELLLSSWVSEQLLKNDLDEKHVKNIKHEHILLRFHIHDTTNLKLKTTWCRQTDVKLLLQKTSSSVVHGFHLDFCIILFRKQVIWVLFMLNLLIWTKLLPFNSLLHYIQHNATRFWILLCRMYNECYKQYVSIEAKNIYLQIAQLHGTISMKFVGISCISTHFIGK